VKAVGNLISGVEVCRITSFKHLCDFASQLVKARVLRLELIDLIGNFTLALLRNGLREICLPLPQPGQLALKRQNLLVARVGLTCLLSRQTYRPGRAPGLLVAGSQLHRRQDLRKQRQTLFQ
jgi:hypothetical protein